MLGIGFLVLEKRRFFAPPFYPVALVCGLMLISAIVNGAPTTALEPITRFLTFVLIAVALWQALESGGSSVLRRLLLVFIQPVTYQVASIALGIPKSGELDGSVSYIGGYYHEELFSLIAATAFFLAIFAGNLGRYARFTICLVSLASIALANYRTTMLGILPLALAAVFILLPKAFAVNQRALARLMIVVGGVAVLGTAAIVEQNRFSDLAVIAEKGPYLIKQPETFTWAEKRELSSRPYIWSTYIYAYADGAPLQKIIGFGPDSWEGRMHNYAHNTVISFLYELGIAGVAAILLLWGSMFRLAFLADKRSRGLLIGGHLSFLVLNLATMAHWQVEGNMLYGLLSGYTIAKARHARVSRLILKQFIRRRYALAAAALPQLSAAHAR
jgi:hypothetical protein